MPGQSDAAVPPSPSLSALDESAAAKENRDLRAKLATAEVRITQFERTNEEDDAKTKGIIPHVLFGPRLSIISLPTPAIGLEVKAVDYLGASFDYGFIPTINVGRVSLGLTTWKVGAKVYPFGGTFQVGAALGSYTFEGKSTTTDFNGQSAPTKVTVNSTFLEPNLGWRWVRSSGFFTAFDLGWKFPLKYASKLDAPEGTSGTVKDIKDKADQYVKSGLPSLGLLQLGWLF